MAYSTRSLNSVSPFVWQSLLLLASTTEHSKSTDALLQGYRAAFWTIFAATVIVVVLTFFGLRKAGLVGKKDD